jgi:hypothetical protein
MKKNALTLIVFLLVGLLFGSLAGELLSGVPGLSFLAETAEIRWEPAADLNVIRYDVSFAIRVNLVSLVGLVAAFILYRKV